MINFLKKIFKKHDFKSIEYWRDRASKFGNKSVVNMSYSESEAEKITQLQKDSIFPIVSKYLAGTTEQIMLLDFGCGPGRFTKDLSVLVKGKAVGIDPVPSFIQAAKESDHHSGNEYVVVDDYTIPFPDKTFNVLWVCLVLGGISEKNLVTVVSELKRVSKDNAILVLTENTTNQKNNEHWFYRSADYYKQLFADFSLTVENSYNELTENITILAGVKK
ncbi:class I SAM-dependent methyltransferase [Ferruginibacter lapsinanis]|uniref:class I SAM-dependent methyltransferase n=1 Tax=Ferruginibacter lapsinanis TaxID=563172 RepID=UPI001E3CEE4B|nr:class I SAM-dependent methyltransferase [Ferruginibacter lapsinanis]UEG49472.1 class I SAM-dependent methyltransferase [Ferruginibacter lapsinanis]